MTVTGQPPPKRRFAPTILHSQRQHPSTLLLRSTRILFHSARHGGVRSLGSKSLNPASSYDSVVPPPEHLDVMTFPLYRDIKVYPSNSSLHRRPFPTITPVSGDLWLAGSSLTSRSDYQCPLTVKNQHYPPPRHLHRMNATLGSNL